MNAAHRAGTAVLAVLPLAVLMGGCAAGEVDDPPSPPPPRPAPEVEAPLANRAPTSLEDAVSAAAAPSPSATSSEKPSAPDASSTPSGERKPEVAPPKTAPAEPPATSTPSAAANPPLGWIAGARLEPEELLLEWGDVASRELYLVLDKLISARLALAEASRLGIRLDPPAVDQRVAAERAELEERAAKDRKDLDLEHYIEQELGLEATRYLERVRLATIRQMLAERAVRAYSLQNESVAIRLIVVAKEEDATAVQAALAAGRDFADVASEFSVDDSKSDGGLVPFVVPQERSPLARLAFQTPVGEVAGPVPIGEHQFLIRVEERRTPLEGDWPAIEKAVEQSLATYPVRESEFLHWKLTMEGRYPIDLGPLRSLIGTSR